MENENINWRKTKAMVVKRGGGICNITVNGVEIENVRTMKYLGGMLEEEGSCEAEIDHRIGAASKVIGALRKEVINRRELNKSTKLRVINATVMSTLLYACKSSPAELVSPGLKRQWCTLEQRIPLIE